MRELRREAAKGEVIVISAADPLNLAGIVTTGERIRAIAATRIAWRDGIPISVMEGDMLRPLATVDAEVAVQAATLLAGRAVSVTQGFVGR
jgi:ATP-dependent Lhr-like helicase